jgi:hypothetical protein
LGYFNGDYQLVVCDSEKFSAVNRYQSPGRSQ